MSAAPGWYRLVDHTGDLALLVRAPTLPDLYDTAARALFDVILNVSAVVPRQRVPVEVAGAADAEDLLVRFLSELLFLHDARGWVFRGFAATELEETRVAGEALGEPLDPSRHHVEREVKAVTYHQLLLSEDRDGWSARLVLDL